MFALDGSLKSVHSDRSASSWSTLSSDTFCLILSSQRWQMAPPRYSAHCQLYMDQLFVVFRLPHLTSFNSAAKTLVEFYICGSCRTGCLPVTFGRCLYRLCGPLSRPADRQTRSPGRGQARLVRVSGHFCVYNQAREYKSVWYFESRGSLKHWPCCWSQKLESLVTPDHMPAVLLTF